MAHPDVPTHECCPVCKTRRVRPLVTLEGKAYWRCRLCEATFLTPSQWPGVSARADGRHELEAPQPQPDSAGPQHGRSLPDLSRTMLSRLPRGLRGLDFGHDPDRTLGAQLEEAGHEITQYEPMSLPDPTAVDDLYDFAFGAAVLEYLRTPGEVLKALDDLLRPGAMVGIMTEFQTSDAYFEKWLYRRDPRRIIFYRAATLNLLGARLGWVIDIPRRNIALFRKHR